MVCVEWLIPESAQRLQPIFPSQTVLSSRHGLNRTEVHLNVHKYIKVTSGTICKGWGCRTPNLDLIWDLWRDWWRPFSLAGYIWLQGGKKGGLSPSLQWLPVFSSHTNCWKGCDNYHIAVCLYNSCTFFPGKDACSATLSKNPRKMCL